MDLLILLTSRARGVNAVVGIGALCVSACGSNERVSFGLDQLAPHDFALVLEPGPQERVLRAFAPIGRSELGLEEKLEIEDAPERLVIVPITLESILPEGAPYRFDPDRLSEVKLTEEVPQTCGVGRFDVSESWISLNVEPYEVLQIEDEEREVFSAGELPDALAWLAELPLELPIQREAECGPPLGPFEPYGAEASIVPSGVTLGGLPFASDLFRIVALVHPIDADHLLVGLGGGILVVERGQAFDGAPERGVKMRQCPGSPGGGTVSAWHVRETNDGLHVLAVGGCPPGHAEVGACEPAEDIGFIWELEANAAGVRCLGARALPEIVNGILREGDSIVAVGDNGQVHVFTSSTAVPDTVRLPEGQQPGAQLEDHRVIVGTHQPSRPHAIGSGGSRVFLGNAFEAAWTEIVVPSIRISGANIASVAAEDQGVRSRLWVGTQNGGLFRLEPEPVPIRPLFSDDLDGCVSLTDECGRRGFDHTVRRLIPFPQSGPATHLLGLLTSCSHGFAVRLRDGCSVAIGAGEAQTQERGSTGFLLEDDFLWMGGEDGELYRARIEQ